MFFVTEQTNTYSEHTIHDGELLFTRHNSTFIVSRRMNVVSGMFFISEHTHTYSEQKTDYGKLLFLVTEQNKYI